MALDSSTKRRTECPQYVLISFVNHNHRKRSLSTLPPYLIRKLRMMKLYTCFLPRKEEDGRIFNWKHCYPLETITMIIAGHLEFLREPDCINFRISKCPRCQIEE